MDILIDVKSLFPDLEFLGSRGAGEVIRAEMERIFKENNNAIIDFDEVSGITQSFGDEIIGIFVRAFGVSFIKQRVKIVNANNKIKEILNFVIHYSKKYSAA